MAYDVLKNHHAGDEVQIHLGVGYDDLSSSIDLEVIVKEQGDLVGFMMHDPNSVFGHCVNVNIKNTNIDVMVADTGWAVCEVRQFDVIGINITNYDVIVVKQGYIFPEFKELGKLCIMSLTQGATLQDTASLPFKRVMRPMFPIDKI